MTEEKKKESRDISRREFLKDAGLVVGGAAIGSAVILAACDGETETVTNTVTKTVTSTAQGETATVTKTVTEVNDEAAENVISLTVNGKAYDFQVKPEETLRDLLRNQLGLTSTKDMCFEQGACGSCTVIMNERPVLSCMVLAIECDGATIETSEGLLAAKHPLIDMYIKHAALQCGFCTPGFVMTAKALLDRNPNPTEADIREALGGNICRCASYPGHIPAVLAAAEMLGGG